MNQAGNHDGSYEDGWHQDGPQLPPSLGVWPLGRTYVHSSDGALNTGSSGGAGPSPNGHGAAPLNANGRVSGNGRHPASTTGSGAGGHARPAPAGGHGPGSPAWRDQHWASEQGFAGTEHMAVPPFTGAVGDGSTPLYERLALSERFGGPPPDDPGPRHGGRPPLYQVGGRYRGDDWPTDPGFRRGDLGLEDFHEGASPDPGTNPARPDPAFGGHDDPGFGGHDDPGHGEPRRDPGFGGPDPSYGGPGRRTGQGWQGADPDGTADAGPGSYPPPGLGAAPGRGAHGYDASHGPGPRSADHRQPPWPAPAPGPAYDAGAGVTPQRPARSDRPERSARRQRHPEPVTPIRPETAAGREPGRQGGEPPGRQGPQTWERNVTPAARVAAIEDAKLLAFLHDLMQRLKAVPSLYPRLVFLVVGYAAITSLAAAYAEAIPLPITASLIVIPAAGIIFNMGVRHPDWGRRALVGWLAGVIATVIYDCLRLSLVKVGVWGDPIPGIGRLVFADPHANFAWGYFWRFAGNGGGMGIAYTMLPWRGIRTGVAYGTLICTGLVALLFFFPVAQVHFFPLTPVTTVGAYAGHWVYGAVLGKIVSWWLPPVELGRIHGRLTARLIHPGHRPRPAHARSSGAAGDIRRAAARRSA
jgi:hypothetical protein